MNKEDNQEQIICVASTGDTIDSEIDSHFGRCEYFIIIKIKNNKIINSEAIKNIGVHHSHGVGISAAEIVGKSGAKIVISGNFGPKAIDVLKQLGIKTRIESGIVKDVIKNL